MRSLVLMSLVAALAAAGPAIAATKANPETPANVTVEQVKSTMAAGKDLSGKSLMNLDLSGMDLSNANLAGANLHGAKLTRANLTHANLTGANLDLAMIIGTNFTDANLTDASLDGPVVAMGLDAKTGEIPIMRGANLTDARVLARFTGGQLQGAKFVGADVGAHMKNQSMGLMHTEMMSANLEGADFSNAKLGHADFSYADLKGANFKGADLSRAVLTGADLSGADLTDADLDGGRDGRHQTRRCQGPRSRQESRQGARLQEVLKPEAQLLQFASRDASAARSSMRIWPRALLTHPFRSQSPR